MSAAHAANYNCRVSAFKLEMQTNKDLTDLIIRDAQSGEYFYNGIVSEVIDRDGRIDLMFETRSHSFLKLEFKSSDFNNDADTLFGFAQGWAGAGFLNDSLRCYKKTI
jgi:hypothetical protein